MTAPEPLRSAVGCSQRRNISTAADGPPVRLLSVGGAAFAAVGLSAGTLKNCFAHLRWWAEKVGKAGIIPAESTQLGISERRFVTNEDKSRQLGARLERVTDPHVRASLKLQEVFGLRREESIKFQPSYADRISHVLLKGSWTKGGRPRAIPITTPEQYEGIWELDPKQLPKLAVAIRALNHQMLDGMIGHFETSILHVASLNAVLRQIR